MQRLEVVHTGRRRRWTLAEKQRIVEESFQGDRQASATARRHDISPALLFAWRRQFGRQGSSDQQAASFMRAVVVPRHAAEAVFAGRMEVVTAVGRRVIVGADVDAAALARVVAALEAL